MNHIDFIKEHHEWIEENIPNANYLSELEEDKIKSPVKDKKIENKLKYINELENKISKFESDIKKYRYSDILKAEIIAHNMYNMINEKELETNKDNYCDWTINEIRKDINKLKVGYYSSQRESYKNTLKNEIIKLKEVK